MFINLSPHPRRRLKTRMSPLVSSGLVVQWFLFRGPVALSSPSLLRSGSGPAVCWTPLIPWMLDDIMNPAFIEQELTVLFPKTLFSFSLSCFVVSQAVSEIYSGFF